MKSVTGGTLESLTPSDPSPASSPTRASPNSSFESRSHLAISPSIADQMNGEPPNSILTFCKDSAHLE
jgi:hypothetical protein